MRVRLKVVPFRRRREGKTNYAKRVNLLKSQIPRLIVRPSLQNMNVQIATYNARGDKMVAGTSSQSLKRLGWTVHKGNTPAAYLTGYRLGKIAKKKGITNAILDSGLRTPSKGSRIYACVKGVIDAGVIVPISEEVLPSEERIQGLHIQEKMAQLFHSVKKKIDEANHGS